MTQAAAAPHPLDYSNQPDRGFSLLKRAGSDWMEDKALKLSASLAFYTMLSIAPLLVIAMKIVGTLFGQDAARGQVKAYLEGNMGPRAAAAVQEMVAHAGAEGSGVMATIISSVILAFSASGVFGELQDSMNTIWNVKPKPDAGFMETVKNRFFSFTLVLGVAFLLMVSLIASTLITAISHRILPAQGWLWQSVNFIFSFAVISFLFAAMFKYLPDVKVSWKPVLIGGVATALLFTVGKHLLGWYLGRGATTSVYGASASLVAMLLWVYYSAAIFFFGAEFTQVYARSLGQGRQTEKGAVPMTVEERARRGMVSPEDLTVAAHPEWQVPAYPAVPINRDLVIPPAANSTVNSQGSTMNKLIPLVIGIIVGKYFLASRSASGGSSLNFARALEPGYATRNRHRAKFQARCEGSEYVVRMRPPKAVKDFATKVKEKAHTARNRIAEFFHAS